MTVVLAAGAVRVQIDPDDGGRVTSTTVDGLEVIGGVDASVVNHGSFVMAPWAGRVRHGRFSYDGADYQLPLGMPPHAIHGVVLDRPWHVLGADGTTATLACDFDSRWPWGGRAVHTVTVGERDVTFALAAESTGTAYPACIGWHPWFRRRLDRGGPAQLHLTVGSMLAKDAEGIATGEHVPVRPGPWDDCFTDVGWPARLHWPGALSVAVGADTAYAVVFDERDEAVCVEPQTGPPDALTLGPLLVSPNDPLRATMSWTFAAG